MCSLAGKVRPISAELLLHESSRIPPDPGVYTKRDHIWCSSCNLMTYSFLLGRSGICHWTNTRVPVPSYFSFSSTTARHFSLRCSHGFLGWLVNMRVLQKNQ